MIAGGQLGIELSNNWVKHDPYPQATFSMEEETKDRLLYKIVCSELYWEL